MPVTVIAYYIPRNFQDFAANGRNFSMAVFVTQEGQAKPVKQVVRQDFKPHEGDVFIHFLLAHFFNTKADFEFINFVFYVTAFIVFVPYILWTELSIRCNDYLIIIGFQVKAKLYINDIDMICKILNICTDYDEENEDLLYHTLLKSIRPILLHLVGKQDDLISDSDEEQRILSEWIIKMGKIRGSLG